MLTRCCSPCAYYPGDAHLRSQGVPAPSPLTVSVDLLDICVDVIRPVAIVPAVRFVVLASVSSGKVIMPPFTTGLVLIVSASECAPRRQREFASFGSRSAAFSTTNSRNPTPATN
jgi:hypothetical protein